MKTSETIGKLAEALALARKDFRPVLKKSTNPFFKAKYADLAEVIEATSDALIANGLSIIQTPGHVVTIDGTNRVNIESRLVHSSGEWIESEMSLPLSKFDAQGAGSAITYARRYAYQSIVGVAAEPDDDANAASETFQKEGDRFVKQAPAQRGRPKSGSVQTVSATQPIAGEPSVPANTPQESKQASAGANIHGVAITDEDLPDFGQPPVVAKVVSSVTVPVEKPATDEERKAIRERVHKALPVDGDRTKLIHYCEARYKVESVSALSMSKWEEVLSELEAGKIKL